MVCPGCSRAQTAELFDEFRIRLKKLFQKKGTEAMIVSVNSLFMTDLWFDQVDMGWRDQHIYLDDDSIRSSIALRRASCAASFCWLLDFRVLVFVFLLRLAFFRFEFSNALLQHGDQFGTELFVELLFFDELLAVISNHDLLITDENAL